MKNLPKGFLIILEGVEGSGKTTQAKLLEEHYNSIGYSAKYFREPGSNPLAEQIRNMILYNEMDTVTETLLMNAARKINIDTNILPALRNGDIVILDRFTKSTLVYQGILNNGDMNFINTCIDEVTKELMSEGYWSLEFTLICNPEIAIKRANSENHERNKYDALSIEKYKKINNAYDRLFRKYGTNAKYEPFYIEMDTSHISQSEISNKIIDYVNGAIFDLYNIELD